MKLALICRPFSFHGGVETSTAGLVAALVARGGYDVELLTTGRQFPVPGVTIRRLLVPGQPSALRQLCFALAAKKAVGRGSYDLVQSHERCLAQDIYRAGEGCHREYLRTMGREGVQVNPQHRLLLWLERRIFTLQAAQHIVAISARGKSEIERLYGTPAGKVTVVYNGVDLARFHPDNRLRWRDEARGLLGIPRDAWLVAFVGSGFERKGLGPLMEAVATLRPLSVHLLVAGKGRRETYCRLATRLGLDGAVTWIAPRPDVERIYAAADVVAVPARYEPFGNVHLEALASGIPVLTSALTGGAEVVRDGVNGAVIASLEPSAIAQGLRVIRDGDAGRQSLAARASAEPFTYAAQVEGLERIYRLLSPDSSPAAQ
jgi:UDP-glucose:(heptosyl)LPS alpha-1,3-glucosyltransferase